ncbi:hypothetical protein PAXINDRAFT_15538 [Paxillus involutus ATCC 200175]|uniref:Uncharacterized protein n=1 Tax=Paxillus involutus ATCC 200175 TaxID=664439 RepID=A0A0C9SSV3_PAXIN|nr:hypothetical protein PAXINDRAFT_15538 [Paxillus involutus ATCC 200175]
MPADTSNEPPNEANEERQGEKDKRDENDGGGDKDVLHTHIIPHPTPPASEPLPPSTPLDREQGDESSGRAREAATHNIKTPQVKPRGQDDDGTDDDDQHARVAPQEPQTTGQMANDEAADTSNPNADSARPTMPVGTSCGLRSESNENEEGKKGIEDKKGEWASGIEDPSSNDNSGDEDIHHVYVVPNTTQPVPYHALPTPNERSPPPSMPLEGENGQQSSGHINETATYLKDPRQESSTTTPIGTPYDEMSNREGPGGAVGGGEEVEGSDNETNTLYGDDKKRRRREDAEGCREVDREVEGGHKVKRMENEVEHHNDATDGEEEDGKSREQMGSTSNVKENEQDSPRTPPEPPPPSAAPPAPSPNSPERLRNDETTTTTMSTLQTADALHNPDGKMKVTPSVRLEGERIEDSSRYVELTDIDAEEDGQPPDQSKTKKPSRNPVGTMDGHHSLAG